MDCRVCDSTDLDIAIDLGNQPWGNHFLRKEQVGTEPFYPLRVLFCCNCKTAQLDYTVKKEVMFGDHTYLSGVTRTLSENFRRIAEEVDSRFFRDCKEKSVLDIGSNDGTQLKHYQALGYHVLGIESSKSVAQMANAVGIPTVNSFFNEDVARAVGRRFDVINAAGIFFHLEELHSFTEGVKASLSERGVFVIQFLYMKSIMENLAFDQIYHEHLLYYNVTTVEEVLRRHGLGLFDAYLSPIHGGSIIAFAGHREGLPPSSSRLGELLSAEVAAGSNTLAAYRRFAKRLDSKREELLGFLDRRKGEGKRIYGFGAPVKGNTLLNYCGIGIQYLDCLVEKNMMRRGLYSPGMHIPVEIEGELTALPDVYFVLAWNFKKEILANNQALLDKGIEFHFPIDPDVECAQ